MIGNRVQQLRAEAVRRCALVILNGDAGYQCGESILKQAVCQSGYPVSTDFLRQQIVWLEESGLLVKEDKGGRYQCKITQRGQDVAESLAVVPGVARDLPEL